jgi:hypothetical protein
MSWLESLTKEMFQAMVREAVQQGLASFKNGLASVNVELEDIKHRLDKLEIKVDRFYENQMDLAGRAGHLEGTIESRLRGLVTEIKYDLYERLHRDLAELASGAKPAPRKKGRKTLPG